MLRDLSQGINLLQSRAIKKSGILKHMVKLLPLKNFLFPREAWTLLLEPFRLLKSGSSRLSRYKNLLYLKSSDYGL